MYSTEDSVQSFKETSPHSCYTEGNDIIHQEARAKIIAEVSGGRDQKTSNVHQEIQAGLEQEVAVSHIVYYIEYMTYLYSLILTASSLSSAVSRAVNKNLPTPPTSADVISFVGEKEQLYSTTGNKDITRRRQFLLHQESFNMNIGGPPQLETILIFGTLQMMGELFRSQRWFMDGAFIVAPTYFN